MTTQQVKVNERLAALTAAGTSVWLDEIGRRLIESGELGRLVQEDCLRGVTSNPTIFNQAILGSDDYDDQLAELARDGRTTREIYQGLVIRDIQMGCDVLRSVYDATERYDGYVSLEVDPDLAFDTGRTMEQAREYWGRVDRPNLMIKIHGTLEGVPAIEEMIYEGRNINVTLLFAVEAYERVAEACIRGLERRREEGQCVDVRSVASFFVSRVDSEVDQRLDKIGSEEAKQLKGKAAIANAQLAYQHYEKAFDSDRWRALAAAGAHPQRPLWASTSTKNPDYRDVMYVEELVAPGVVNTMPEPTIHAFADHGEVKAGVVQSSYEQAQGVLDRLEALGIGYDDVTATLEREGVEKFAASWEELRTGVEAKLGVGK
jgi:transaldolase